MTGLSSGTAAPLTALDSLCSRLNDALGYLSSNIQGLDAVSNKLLFEQKSPQNDQQIKGSVGSEGSIAGLEHLINKFESYNSELAAISNKLQTII